MEKRTLNIDVPVCKIIFKKKGKPISASCTETIWEVSCRWQTTKETSSRKTVSMHGEAEENWETGLWEPFQERYVEVH